MSRVDSGDFLFSMAMRETTSRRLSPPYRIKLADNFQPEVGRRDVKDKEQDLTREPERVRAYRDTWHLGIHSRLSYMRGRLVTIRARG